MVIPISAEQKALRMCVEALLKCAIRHMQVLVHRAKHKADRLMTSTLMLLFLAICMCLSPQSGCVKKLTQAQIGLQY